ncbi:RNAase [Ancylomarina salipaludis]|uniref:RNAase n=1 Tax=Ancylomarina salipaludis TaxID=2501299 RepID=A0A4Q1JJB4_9BACT|nr:phospholipid scramblase-related protein [Ancylomarina salipaludis]RXQ88467.1 RNAase [Ancylomarina salipaludis]
MNPILNRNLYFVKEHVGMFKAANNFDILDPENQEMIMNCREENLGFFTKLFRFTGYKRMTPFDVEIKTIPGAKVLRVKRGVSLFLSKVEVFDENEQLVGRFKQKFFSIGGKFSVFDVNDKQLCTLKGKWTSWDFKFMKDNVELAHVSKKWAGIGKELFTTADNYILEIKDNVPTDQPIRVMILAAVMCIDMVLKE